MTVAIELDELDEAIVQCLQADGRMSNRAIGRAVGLSEGGIRKRLKRLIDGGAITYGVLVDRQAIGFEASAWLRIKAQAARVPSIASYIAELSSCTFCVIGTGARPIRAYIYAPDRAMLASLVTQISSQPGVVDVSVSETTSIEMLRHQYIFLPGDENSIDGPAS